MGQNYGSGIAAVGLMKAPPAAAGGSQTVTIFDDFTDDTDAHYDGAIAVCTQASGDMTLDAAGLCLPKVISGGTPPGEQPSTVNQWGLVHLDEVNGAEKHGISLRTAEAQGATDDSYAAWCDTIGQTGLVHLYNCTNTYGCTEFHETGIVCAGSFGGDTIGDIIGFAVAGTGAGTEFCVWFWENAAAGPTIDNTTVPADWGNAAECISDGTPYQSTMADFFTNADATVTWDATPDVANGYSDTNLLCGMITPGSPTPFTDFVCGDL